MIAPFYNGVCNGLAGLLSGGLDRHLELLRVVSKPCGTFKGSFLE